MQTVTFSKDVTFKNWQIEKIDFTAIFKNEELWSLDYSNELSDKHHNELQEKINQGIFDGEAEQALQLELENSCR